MSWLKNLISGIPDRDKFARIGMDYLKKNGNNNLKYDREGFCIYVLDDTGKAEGTVNLTNAYADYCNSPKELRGILLENHFGKQEEFPETLHDAIFHILPRLQPKIFYVNNELRFAIDSTKNLPAAPLPRYSALTEHFGVSLVLDTPRSVLYLGDKQLEEWGTSLEEILPRAITNLTGATPEPFQPITSGLYYCNFSDSHDASRVLINHRVEACRVKGRPVAFTPNRDTLLITGEDDVEGLTQAAMLVEETMQKPRPMPTFPMVYNGAGAWETWEAPEGHGAYTVISNMIHLAHAVNYSDQKSLLEEKNKIERRDIFVATFTLLQQKDSERYTSISTWADKVVSLLPKTDLIAIETQSKKEQFLLVPWEKVAEIVGERLRVQDIYPQRFLVESSPDAAELNKLKEFKING